MELVDSIIPMRVDGIEVIILSNFETEMLRLNALFISDSIIRIPSLQTTLNA